MSFSTGTNTGVYFALPKSDKRYMAIGKGWEEIVPPYYNYFFKDDPVASKSQTMFYQFHYDTTTNTTYLDTNA